jgi:hypothetical protein
MKEVEFVCVNKNNKTEQKNQDDLFESLKEINKLIVYREYLEKRNSLSAIINTPSKKEMLKTIKEIRVLANKNNIEIDFVQEISREFTVSIKEKNINNLDNFYIT